MTILTVTNVEDDGNGSLRAAIALANLTIEADTIRFADGLCGSTIRLTSGELFLSQDLIIDGDINGDRKADVTITGDADANGIGNAGDSRQFSILGAGVEATLRSLTLTGGYLHGTIDTPHGGAVSAGIETALTIIDCTIVDNVSQHTLGSGGGVYAEGTLTIVNSLIAGNRAGIGGGVALGSDADGLLLNTTVDGNFASDGGAGVFASGNASLALISCTVTRNVGLEEGYGAVFVGGQSTLIIGSTVIAENFDEGGPKDFNYGSDTTVFGSNNFIGTRDGAPQLGELLDNGGTVLTRSPLDGSPLIDTGSNPFNDVTDLDTDGDTAEPLPLDGRRAPRLAGTANDIGAVEQVLHETIRGDAQSNNLLGGTGNDRLFGLGNADNLFGGDGEDALDGGAGIDNLIGGLGNDTYVLGGETTGVDAVIDDGGTKDVITTSISRSLADYDGIERLHLLGTAAISGFGNQFDNVIAGNAANNALRGGLGHDVLDGNAGNDTLSYEDITTGGVGVTVSLNTAAAQNTGAAGTDTIDDVEHLIGTRFNDTLTGNGFGNTLVGGLGNDTLNGLGGTDTASYKGLGAAVNVNLSIAIAQNTGGAGTDTLLQIENLFGGQGNDTLTGNSSANTLWGDIGNDTLLGSGGADTLFGGVGNDELNGGTGNDLLVGEAGLDRFVFGLNYDTDTVNGFENDLDTLLLNDNLWGGGRTVQQVLDTYGTQTDADTFTLDFGAGDILIINQAGISKTMLVDDVTVI